MGTMNIYESEEGAGRRTAVLGKLRAYVADWSSWLVRPTPPPTLTALPIPHRMVPLTPLTPLTPLVSCSGAVLTP